MAYQHTLRTIVFESPQRQTPRLLGLIKLWSARSRSRARLGIAEDRILEDIPKDLMDKLMRVPYFEKGFSTDGYSRDEYNTHPALQKTAEQFSKATDEMVAFAGKCLEA